MIVRWNAPRWFCTSETSLTRQPGPMAACCDGVTASIGASWPVNVLALRRVVFGSSEGRENGLSGIHAMITATPATSTPKPTTAYHACARCC